MKIIGLSKCGLAVLLLTGSEYVEAEKAGPGQEVGNWRRDRSTPTGVAFSRGFRLYDLVFPSGVLGGQLQLVLGTTHLGSHRLLVLDTAASEMERGERKLAHIVPLQGNPSIRSALPDKPLGSPTVVSLI